MYSFEPAQIPSAVVLSQNSMSGVDGIFFPTGVPSGEGTNYNLLTTLKVLPALPGVQVLLNTEGSRIVRILLCLKRTCNQN